MKVLYIVNSSSFFCSHFLTLAESVKNEGAEVFVAAGDKEKRTELVDRGFNFVELTLSRKGINVFSEISSIINLRGVICRIKPDIVHAFTIKPVIYSGLINRMFRGIRAPLHIASITGLGSASLSRSFQGKLLWMLLKQVYKLSLGLSNVKVVFENRDDLNHFVQLGIVLDSNAFVVNGAGIDTSFFCPPESREIEPLKVVMVARFLKDKGVREYIDAGRKIKKNNINAQLLLVGSIDENNTSSLLQSDIDLAHQLGYVDCLGQRNDIAAIYQKCNVACLPSYREGLPKSLIEAAACGVAILTTDVPGCRQMIFDGKNGVLFEPQNSDSIVSLISKLVEEPDLVRQMGVVSRIKALELFDHSSIIKSFFDIYDFNSK
ncbi:glycosyltransferase family 4 protein [Moritella sp. 5]|uniref:glycosyltransferase family 4 protein n=1 Tax=Moritella sp. 5 TaxID=2746231 RepID=UPI001BACA657|nr:glycosyltransferase family 4 protein [Moritella sp. 5]QUM79395.1 glycosyltransferase family 4 protein [Moritella sp. 5]